MAHRRQSLVEVLAEWARAGDVGEVVEEELRSQSEDIGRDVLKLAVGSVVKGLPSAKIESHFLGLIYGLSSPKSSIIRQFC